MTPLRCISTHCNTTVLDCILYLMQYLYNPGILPSSANYCILGTVYLRSSLSRKQQQVDNVLHVKLGHLQFWSDLSEHHLLVAP